MRRTLLPPTTRTYPVQPPSRTSTSTRGPSVPPTEPNAHIMPLGNQVEPCIAGEQQNSGSWHISATAGAEHNLVVGIEERCLTS